MERPLRAETLFAKVGTLELGEALHDLRDAGISLAVIDTPPAITQSIAHVISYADLVILPTRPSPHDLRAVGATVDAAERYAKPLIFVINAATARARITGETAVALSQHGTVAPVTVHQRVNFASSMIDGRTVGEIVPKSPPPRKSGSCGSMCGPPGGLNRDPAFKPLIEPAHFAVSGLTASTPNGATPEEPDEWPEAVEQAQPIEAFAVPEPAVPLEASDVYTGPERRSVSTVASRPDRHRQGSPNAACARSAGASRTIRRGTRMTGTDQMSSSFATMTSSLLVRKGDAGPSVVALPLRQSRAAAMPTESAPAFSYASRRRGRGAEGGRADKSQKLHHIGVALTTGDLQRIGLRRSRPVCRARRSSMRRSGPISPNSPKTSITRAIAWRASPAHARRWISGTPAGRLQRLRPGWIERRRRPTTDRTTRRSAPAWRPERCAGS